MSPTASGAGGGGSLINPATLGEFGGRGGEIGLGVGVGGGTIGGGGVKGLFEKGSLLGKMHG